MKITRRCTCGNLTTVYDYDEPAVCEECLEADVEDLNAARRWHDQAGAQWLAHEQGMRDRYG